MPSRAAVGTQPTGREHGGWFSAKFQVLPDSRRKEQHCSAPRVMRSRDSWSRGLRLGFKLPALGGGGDMGSTGFTNSPGRRETFVQLCHFMEIISGPAKLETQAETDSSLIWSLWEPYNWEWGYRPHTAGSTEVTSQGSLERQQLSGH